MDKLYAKYTDFLKNDYNNVKKPYFNSTTPNVIGIMSTGKAEAYKKQRVIGFNDNYLIVGSRTKELVDYIESDPNRKTVVDFDLSRIKGVLPPPPKESSSDEIEGEEIVLQPQPTLQVPKPTLQVPKPTLQVPKPKVSRLGRSKRVKPGVVPATARRVNKNRAEIIKLIDNTVDADDDPVIANTNDDSCVTQGMYCEEDQACNLGTGKCVEAVETDTMSIMEDFFGIRIIGTKGDIEALRRAVTKQGKEPAVKPVLEEQPPPLPSRAPRAVSLNINKGGSSKQALPVVNQQLPVVSPKILPSNNQIINPVDHNILKSTINDSKIVGAINDTDQNALSEAVASCVGI